jgi:hypothetical protein
VTSTWTPYFHDAYAPLTESLGTQNMLKNGPSDKVPHVISGIPRVSFGNRLALLRFH